MTGQLYANANANVKEESDLLNANAGGYKKKSKNAKSGKKSKSAKKSKTGKPIKKSKTGKPIKKIKTY